MRISLTFKSPDAVDEALHGIDDATLLDGVEYDQDDLADAKRDARDKLGGIIGQWVTYGEYVTIEIDTEANTAIVVPR